jgi:hypothetical protein
MSCEVALLTGVEAVEDIAKARLDSKKNMNLER